MSKERKQYNVADIQQYLGGGMSNSDMRLLEMAALDDPFLQDALDGFVEAYDTREFTEIEAALKAVSGFEPAHLHDRQAAVVIPLWRRYIVQYAVASALVLGSGWFIFNAMQKGAERNESMRDVALVKPKTVKKPSMPAAIPVQKLPEEQLAVATKKISSKTGTAYNATTSSPDLPQTQNDEISTFRLPLSQVADSVSGSKADKEAVARNTVPITPPAEIANKSANIKNAPNVPLQGKVAGPGMAISDARIISGKVVDADKFPLDNITLQIKGTKQAVVSDELGRFRLSMADSNTTLIVSGPGYKQQEFKAAAGNAEMELQLKPAATSLNEVVVSGYLSRKKKESAPEIDTSEASPKGGWKNFETYLLQNKKQYTANKPGKVVVTFEVDENGRPAEFDIIKSGGNALDKEAMRLLKEGPRWINKTTDSTAMVKVTLQF